jgi:tRNA-2-methylthio-N6-dimethylallyladenosine synthase
MQHTDRLRYFQYTWGCQMNEADSGMAARLLEAAGYEETATPREADIIFLNTCSVREKPEQKAFSRLGELRHLKEERPEAIVVLAGCMAQRLGEKILKRMPHIDILLGPRQLHRLPHLINEARQTGRRQVAISLDHEPIPTWDMYLEAAGSRVESARYNPFAAYVTVMQGCSYLCAYCIVPHVRGKAVSHPHDQIVQEIRRLAGSGCGEVMLLGQNILAYGKDRGKSPRFADLLQRVHDVDGIERIRFTTGHPRDVDDGLLETIAALPKVCRHFHVPIQAGHDRILRDMKRRYTVQKYEEIAARIRAILPDSSITSDMMVGFPGETAEEFEASLETYARLRFDQAFMFAFSPRPGTPAAEMPGQVPSAVKRERLLRLIELQNRITAEINCSFEGKTLKMLVEGPDEKGSNRLCGRTRCHRLVIFDGPESLAGRTVSVQVTVGHLWGLEGQVTG